ncbi:hypothetical protein ACU18_15365 [Arthrobacter sp. ZBG10]|nr:hypothetical protein ACU18_15365 [Arthrobacter sp. ZBG10]
MQAALAAITPVAISVDKLFLAQMEQGGTLSAQIVCVHVLPLTILNEQDLPDVFWTLRDVGDHGFFQ